MLDCKKEVEKRIEYIKKTVESANAKGVVFGNSGGKDSALVGILCKMALPDKRVIGVMMPCESRRNFEADLKDAASLSEKYGIENISVDLTAAKAELCKKVSEHFPLTDSGRNNVAPRLRMTTVYLVGASLNLLVAGTGNRCEIYTGYFTKWGDGAYDFNPIADLTVSEIYQLLAYLDCPKSIIEKAPSGGLFDGQTDESEMGVTYANIEAYLAGNKVDKASEEKIKALHSRSEHKRIPASLYNPKET